MQFTNAEILAMSNGGFFGQGNAQLPNSLMLMIDQINHIADTGGNFDKGQLDASLKIHPDHWFFNCHFRGDPGNNRMPGP